jgi:serine/threonine protein kinase
MNEPASPTSSHRLEAAVVEFVEGLERGESPDRAALLARYADVSVELAEFFADHDRMNHLARPPSSTDMQLDQTQSMHSGAPGSSDATWKSVTRFAAPSQLQIGQYEILEEIGRGGMGVVYKARHLGLKREVALKTILAGQFASPEDRSRFHAEAVAAAKLSHPGIVPIFEVGDAEGQPFFSMPLIAGHSLAQQIRSGPISPQSAARLLVKIATAVSYAHAHGVIHRDLKPGNILLAMGEESGEIPAGLGLESCEPKITDFGLAKRLGDGDNLTTTGQILGTPSYMPPEQASGRRHEVGPAADIYALGAILYAMLTGRAPFVSENPVEVILQVIEREPPLPSSLRPGVPRELEWICLKCLEKSPQARYASAADLAADLHRYLRHEPPLAQQPGIAQRLRRWIRRKPVLAAHVIGLALTIAVGQIIFFVHPNRDLFYHLRLCGMLLLWMAASYVCQWLMERQRTREWPLYLWTAADALLLTATLRFMDGPLGLFIGAYILLVAVSGLAGRTQLVAFTTAASMLAHLLLMVLKPDVANPLHYAVFAQMTIALSGLAVGYQIWRMNVLQEYYGERA